VPLQTKPVFKTTIEQAHPVLFGRDNALPTLCGLFKISEISIQFQLLYSSWRTARESLLLCPYLDKEKATEFYRPSFG